MTKLILTDHYWAKSLEDCYQVDFAFLDSSKAFDIVFRKVLFKTVMQPWGFCISSSRVRELSKR